MGSVVAILIGLALESCNSEERVSAAKRAADVTALDRESRARQPGRPKPPSALQPEAGPSEQRRPPTKRRVTKQRPAAKPSARRIAPQRPRCVPRPAHDNRASTATGKLATPKALAPKKRAQREATKARTSSWVPEPVRPPLRLDTRRYVGASPSFGGLR